MTALLRVLALWRAETLLLLVGAAVAMLSVGASAGLAMTAGRAIVPAALGGVILFWLLRTLGAGRVVLRYLERLLTHAATFRALSGLRVWLFRGLARSGLGGLGALRSGDALARLVDDVQALDGLYIRIAIPALSLVVLLPLLLWAMWPAGPAPAMGEALLLLLAAVVLPLIAARRASDLGATLTASGAGLRVAALDAVVGRREVRAFGAEDRMLQSVQARERALLTAQDELSRRGAWAQAGAVLCGQAALLVVLIAGLPADHLLPALLLTLAAFETVAVMPRAGVQLGLAVAAARRIVAAADAPPPILEPASPLPAPTGNAIRFERVTFAYPGRPPVLDEFSLEIPAGARIALLGPSGAGKSTIAALALRVAAPQSGRITLGGVDLRQLSSADVHARFAWLSQSTTLFEDTVRANLLLGRPHASDEALWQALAQAGIDAVVRSLPDGLDTWLGAAGAGLSGGQSRRVALARALLSRAPILILDEPATGLDTTAERAFFTTLNDVADGRTIVLIVHRLTGVERLDRIWRLSGGKAVAAAG